MGDLDVDDGRDVDGLDARFDYGDHRAFMRRAAPTRRPAATMRSAPSMTGRCRTRTSTGPASPTTSTTRSPRCSGSATRAATSCSTWSTARRAAGCSPGWRRVIPRCSGAGPAPPPRRRRSAGSSARTTTCSALPAARMLVKDLMAHFGLAQGGVSQRAETLMKAAGFDPSTPRWDLRLGSPGAARLTTSAADDRAARPVPDRRLSGPAAESRLGCPGGCRCPTVAGDGDQQPAAALAFALELRSLDGV